MRPFEDYVATGKDVKKIPIDKNLVKSLTDQATRRLAYVEPVQITADNSDFVLEHYYEALRTLADAVLALNGYKSYSHEASIAYFANDKDFSPMLLEGFDRLRRKRHGIHYYGQRVSITDAQEARTLSAIIAPKLKAKLVP
jgi:hypothetical protein